MFQFYAFFSEIVVSSFFIHRINSQASFLLISVDLSSSISMFLNSVRTIINAWISS